MYKPIPGMLNTCITDTLEFCTRDGESLSLEEKDGKVKLNRCGSTSWFDKQFIQLCAWFEVPVFVKLQTVRFVKLQSIRKAIPIRAIYLTPYYYDLAQKFRISPLFPQYAVSADGRVINMVKNVEMPQYLTRRYPTINGYSPLTQDYTSIFVHVLVASAWVTKGIMNGLFVSVNHIDGIRSNNACTNLEWCTSQYNLSDSHARTRLRKEYVGRVRDNTTGEVTSYKTYAEMAEFIGMTVHGKNKFCKARINKLFRGKYEVRLAGDDRPWFYANSDVQNIAPSRYVITVHEPLGVCRIFNGIMKLKEFYGMRTTLHDTDGVIALFKELFPGYVIAYQDLSPAVKFQVLNMETGVVTVFSSLSKIAKQTALPMDRVYALMVSKGILCANGVRIRRFSEDPWPEKYKTTYATSKIRYKIVDSLTNTITYFKTLAEASLKCDCSIRSLRRMIQGQYRTDRYIVTIEPVEELSSQEEILV